jgi:MFS family permease
VLAAQGKSRSLETVLSALGIRHTDLPEKQSARTIYRSWPIELVRGGFFLVSSLYAISWMLSGFIYYILANWLPSLLASSGWLTSDAQRTVTFLYSGGMAGGLLLSWIVDRLGHRGIFIVASAYVVGAFLFITAPHWLAMPSFYLFVAAFGITIGGAQYVLGALAARLYPPQLLATSLSWIGSVSRIGSVSGPLVGGWMMLSGWNTTQIMTALSIIPMLTAVTLVALAFAAIRRASASNGDQGPP